MLRSQGKLEQCGKQKRKCNESFKQPSTRTHGYLSFAPSYKRAGQQGEAWENVVSDVGEILTLDLSMCVHEVYTAIVCMLSIGGPPFSFALKTLGSCPPHSTGTQVPVADHYVFFTNEDDGLRERRAFLAGLH